MGTSRERNTNMAEEMEWVSEMEIEERQTTRSNMMFKSKRPEYYGCQISKLGHTSSSTEQFGRIH